MFRYWLLVAALVLVALATPVLAEETNFYGRYGRANKAAREMDWWGRNPARKSFDDLHKPMTRGEGAVASLKAMEKANSYTDEKIGELVDMADKRFKELEGKIPTINPSGITVVPAPTGTYPVPPPVGTYPVAPPGYQLVPTTPVIPNPAPHTHGGVTTPPVTPIPQGEANTTTVVPIPPVATNTPSVTAPVEPPSQPAFSEADAREREAKPMPFWQLGLLYFGLLVCLGLIVWILLRQGKTDEKVVTLNTQVESIDGPGFNARANQAVASANEARNIVSRVENQINDTVNGLAAIRATANEASTNAAGAETRISTLHNDVHGPDGLKESVDSLRADHDNLESEARGWARSFETQLNELSEGVADSLTVHDLQLEAAECKLNDLTMEVLATTEVQGGRLDEAQKELNALNARLAGAVTPP